MPWMWKIILICVLVITAGTAAQSQSQSEEFRKIGPISKEFLLNGKPLDPKSIKPRTDGPDKFPHIVYTFLECRVNWDEECEGTVSVDAPDGWIVCEALYRETESNERRGKEILPRAYLPNDIEQPPRFRSVSFRIWAKGSGSIFDRYGSVIRLEDVGVSIVPLDITNEQRFGLGCWMPSP